jgi:hypothetical protein
MLRYLAVFLAAVLPAQVVRVANYSAAPYSGWKRVTVDRLPPHAAGRVGDVRYVVGRPCGLDLWAVDLRVTLAPGQELTVDLAAGAAEPFELEPLPADLLGHFGGPVTLAGNAAALVSLEADGAGYVVCLRARAGRMLGMHAWVLWYPDQPAMAYGEAVLVASNPAVTDLSETAPIDVTLAFGDSLVWVPGAGIGGRLLAAGQTLADGQGRALPLLFVWLRHLRTGADWSSVGAAADLGVCGVGVQQLLPEGAPLVPIGFSGRAWARRHWPAAVAELHTRAPSAIGPKPRSNDSGGFESQTYHVGGEAMVPDGVGAETVRWLSAIRSHAARPSNHLERDGWPLVIEQHPQLVFWDGRRHWHAGVSPDRLGKMADLSLDTSAGWWGPDVQHHYAGDLAAAARLRWSPVAQWLLERHATIYLLQRTDRPGWSTTGFESAREWACEADLVLHLHRTLRDRVLAARVVARWRSRILTVFVPAMQGKDLLIVWDRDPRVNAAGLGAQWWQESFASAAVWRTCSIVGPAEGMAPCVRIARRVLDTAWHLDADGRYRAQPQGPIDGSANDANPASHSFDGYGMPLCVWLVLKVDPQHAKARAIWAQLMAATGDTARRWMLPIGGGQ